MGRAQKLFEKLISGRNDANFPFDDLCTLLTKLGYTARKTKGSHIIFQRGSSFLNLQPSTGGKAKTYQVRQVREELQKLNLKP
jgi:HicA toxin of bacterial toxin-antitoxin,